MIRQGVERGKAGPVLALLILVLGIYLFGISLLTYLAGFLVLLSLWLIPTRQLLLLIVVAMQFLANPPFTHLGSVGAVDIYLNDVLIVIAFTKIVGERALSSSRRFVPTPLYLPMFLFVVWGAIVQLNTFSNFSAEHFSTTIVSLARAVTQLALVMVFANGVRRTDQLTSVATLMLALATSQAAYGIFQVLVAPHLGFGPEVVSVFEGGEKFSRKFGLVSFWATGFAGSSAGLAYLVLLFMFVWLARIFAEPEHRLQSVLPLMAFCTMLVALILTQKRGGWVGFAAGVMFISCMTRSRRIVLLVVFLAALGMWFSPLIIQRVTEELTPALGGVSSLAIRVITWEEALYISKQNFFFGVGMSGFSLVSSTGVSAHSQYLEILTGMGIPGLVLFLWILGVAFQEAWHLWRHTRDSFFRAFGLGWMGGLFALSILMLADGPVLPSGLSPFWAGLGLVTAANRLHRASPSSSW